MKNKLIIVQFLILSVLFMGNRTYAYDATAECLGKSQGSNCTLETGQTGVCFQAFQASNGPVQCTEMTDATQCGGKSEGSPCNVLEISHQGEKGTCRPLAGDTYHPDLFCQTSICHADLVNYVQGSYACDGKLPGDNCTVSAALDGAGSAGTCGSDCVCNAGGQQANSSVTGAANSINGKTGPMSPAGSGPNATSAVGGGSTTFANPIAYNTVSEVVNALLKNLRGIIATIAIVMIVVGGLMYMLAGGEEKNITRAKTIITSAIIGLAIALAAPSFLQEIYTILGQSPDSAVSAAPSLKKIVENVLAFLLSIAGIIGMIGLIVGGVFYLTAYGDEERIKKGKSIITGSLIGIAVAMAALVLVKQISALIK